MLISQLQKKLHLLPKSPGIYFFYDQAKQLLYIGKATNLHDRVSSYFRPTNTLYQRPIEIFFDQVADIKWQTTDSVLEALIAESNLIGQLHPKYNVDLRDDKTFLGIYITDENFPRVFPARITNQKLPKGEFFGPYTSAVKVKQALKILRKIFPWCNQTLRLAQGKPSRPCLYYHLKLCPGPCANAIDKDDYEQIINNLKLFLRGKKKPLIPDLEKQMKLAAHKKQFEQAGRLRDQLSALLHIHDIALQLTDDIIQLVRQQPWRMRIEGYDISNISGQWSVGSMVTFVDGRPAKEMYRKFKIRTVGGIDDVGMMGEVIKRRLAHGQSRKFSNFRNPNVRLNVQNLNFKNSIIQSEIRSFEHSSFYQHNDPWPLPDLILIDGGQEHYNAVKKILDQNEVFVELLAIAKGQKRKRSDLFGEKSIIKKFGPLLSTLINVREEAHRFAIQYHRLLRSKTLRNRA